MEYNTVKEFGTDFFIEKKSKFIAYCKPVTTEEDAQSFINEIKSQNKYANHNVWAYSLKNGGIMRYSDDGEPKGTAGIPVLDVLKKSDTQDVVIVATRYFGGIMLGGGGLVRAYSHTATLGLAAAIPVVMKECIQAKVNCEYSDFAKFEEFCSKNNAIIDEINYEENVKIKLHVLESDLENLSIDYSEFTKGKGVISKENKNYYPFKK